MDSRVAYLNIWQVLSDAALSTAPEAVRNVAQKRIPMPVEYGRRLKTHVARNCVPHNSVEGDISHITWEFQAMNGMFFSCATFDGTGSYGTSPNKFAMPGQKINLAQKALILLTLMEYCMEGQDDFEAHVDGSFQKLKAKIQQDFDGGVSDLSINYEQICKVSKNIIAADLNDGEVFRRVS